MLQLHPPSSRVVSCPWSGRVSPSTSASEPETVPGDGSGSWSWSWRWAPADGAGRQASNQFVALRPPACSCTARRHN